MSHLGNPPIVSDAAKEAFLAGQSRHLPLAPSYVGKEVDYLLGRFPADGIEDYVGSERHGRGTVPRVDRLLRRRILDEVVYPYKQWLSENGVLDWNDVASRMAQSVARHSYDVAIVDESQDFSANQLRALRYHMAADHAVTFVVDTVQRIYARGFAWNETGFDFLRAVYHKLNENHRNTVEIAAFAAGLLEGIEVEPDGSLPDLRQAKRSGDTPIVVTGIYRDQLQWAIDNVLGKVDLAAETVGFLSPLGGAYQRFLRQRLTENGYEFVDITRNAEWPQGTENIALSTFHSAKGLEFDHVVILGLNNETTTHQDPEIDDQLTVWRRLLAVAIARARVSVTVGYKPGEESDLIGYLKAGTFREVGV